MEEIFELNANRFSRVLMVPNIIELAINVKMFTMHRLTIKQIGLANTCIHAGRHCPMPHVVTFGSSASSIENLLGKLFGSLSVLDDIANVSDIFYNAIQYYENGFGYVALNYD